AAMDAIKPFAESEAGPDSGSLKKSTAALDSLAFRNATNTIVDTWKSSSAAGTARDAVLGLTVEQYKVKYLLNNNDWQGLPVANYWNDLSQQGIQVLADAWRTQGAKKSFEDAMGRYMYFPLVARKPGDHTLTPAEIDQAAAALAKLIPPRDG